MGRLKVLSDSFFREVSKRVSRGLLADDKLMLTLRLVQIYLPSSKQLSDVETGIVHSIVSLSVYRAPVYGELTIHF